MKAKKFLLAAAAVLLLAAQTAFAKSKAKDSASPKLKIVTTIFPEYDWTKQLLGDKADAAELTLLLDNGIDLHSYQPSVQDIAKISDADIFIYVGGESDEWVHDVLRSARNKELVAINLLDVLGERVKQEEHVEGMEAEDEHHHHDGEEHEHHHEKKAVPEDRTLADYEGEWQSLFPYMSQNFKAKTASYMAAAEGFDSNDKAWDFFYEGNKTDTRFISIKKNKVTFTNENGSKVTGTYKYDGFYADCWGETSIRYQFRNTDKKSKAPAYIQFDDHLNFPTKTEHFHIYCGDDPKAMLDIKYSWPTYYPKSIDSEEEMIHEFLKHYIDDDDEHHHDEEEEIEYDEHVWLSLRHAQLLCGAICDTLCAKDNVNAATYRANLAAYTAQLDALDAGYADAVKSAKRSTLLFGDRFPFRYLVDDYGLSYYAAFAGCSAESEASFKTIAFLAQKVDELGLQHVMQLENSKGKIARTIIQNSKNKKAQILTLDSMQSTTSRDIRKGATYLGTMQKNLTVLKTALN